jgi:NADPH2 dehydrogenase
MMSQLIDQFLQTNSNTRTDAYGGSIENRSRFCLEVVDAVVAAVGAHRVGIRLSPWSTFQSMRMPDDGLVIAQFNDVIQKLKPYNLAYLSLVESRMEGGSDKTEEAGFQGPGLDFAYDLWDGPIVVAGGYTPESARKLVDEERPEKDIVVAFGRSYISTPDLPYRVKKRVALTPYDRSKFYLIETPEGYTDWPFSKEWEEEFGKAGKV